MVIAALVIERSLTRLCEERDQQIARLNDLLSHKDAELTSAKKQAEAALVALGKACA